MVLLIAEAEWLFSASTFSEARSVRAGFFWSDTMLPRWALSGAQGCWLPLPYSLQKKACPFYTCHSKHPAEPELGGAELYLLLHSWWNTFLIFLNAPLRTAIVLMDQTAHRRKFFEAIHRRSSAFWQPLHSITPSPPQKWYSVMGKHQRQYWYLFLGW